MYTIVVFNIAKFILHSYTYKEPAPFQRIVNMTTLHTYLSPGRVPVYLVHSGPQSNRTVQRCEGVVTGKSEYWVRKWAASKCAGCDGWLFGGPWNTRLEKNERNCDVCCAAFIGISWTNSASQDLVKNMYVPFNIGVFVELVCVLMVVLI